MANKIKLKGTTENQFDIGLGNSSQLNVSGATLTTSTPTVGDVTLQGRNNDYTVNPTEQADKLSFIAGGETTTGAQGASLYLTQGVSDGLSWQGGGITFNGGIASSSPTLGDGSVGGEVVFNTGQGDTSGYIAFSTNNGLTQAGGISFATGTAGSGGYIAFSPSNTNSLILDGSGEWQVGPSNDPGTTGQVLTSQGAGTSPIWAAGGAGSSTPYVPLTIATPDTFTVPSNTQLLFAEPITVNGYLSVIGDLIDVTPYSIDASPYVPVTIGLTETFTVPANTQLLFAETINAIGYLNVIGDLIDVTPYLPPLTPPAGTSHQIQRNEGGAFYADDKFTFDSIGSFGSTPLLQVKDAYSSIDSYVYSGYGGIQKTSTYDPIYNINNNSLSIGTANLSNTTGNALTDLNIACGQIENAPGVANGGNLFIISGVIKEGTASAVSGLQGGSVQIIAGDAQAFGGAASTVSYLVGGSFGMTAGVADNSQGAIGSYAYEVGGDCRMYGGTAKASKSQTGMSQAGNAIMLGGVAAGYPAGAWGVASAQSNGGQVQAFGGEANNSELCYGGDVLFTGGPAIAYASGTSTAQGGNIVFTGGTATGGATNLQGYISFNTTNYVNFNTPVVQLGGSTGVEGQVFGIDSSGAPQWRNGVLSSGFATLVAGVVTVSDTKVTGSNIILITAQDPNGGTPGYLWVSNIVASTSFDINSASVLDTSIVAYVVI